MTGPLTVEGALAAAASCLEGKVADPQRESEILVGKVLRLSRTEMYRDRAAPVGASGLALITEMAGRRSAGEPLQYVTGVQAFRNLELLVGPGVLVPRPETEIVVERALHLIKTVQRPLVADLGTGSGAIALALATERPDSRVWATEISDGAIAWARRNLARFRASNLMLRSGDLFRPLPARLQSMFDLIVSNPPYLSTEELAAVPGDVRMEPAEALEAGPSGLEVAGRIVEAAPRWLKTGGHLLLETSPRQCDELASLMALRLADVAILPDLTGRSRMAEGRKG